MVVRRGADAAEAEHDVFRGKRALQSRLEADGLVAEIVRPGKTKPPLGEGFDDERQVLVLALSDEELVPDDESAEQSGRFLAPALQVFPAADVLAVDEYLRHRAAAGDRADHARAVAVVELH